MESVLVTVTLGGGLAIMGRGRGTMVRELIRTVGSSDCFELWHLLLCVFLMMVPLAALTLVAQIR